MKTENYGAFFIKTLIVSIFAILVLLVWNYGLNPLLKPVNSEEKLINRCYVDRKAGLYMGTWQGNIKMKIDGVYINNKEIYIDTSLTNPTGNNININNYGLVRISNSYTLPFLGQVSNKTIAPGASIKYAFKIKLDNLKKDECNPNELVFTVDSNIETYKFYFNIAWN